MTKSVYMTTWAICLAGLMAGLAAILNGKLVYGGTTLCARLLLKDEEGFENCIHNKYG